MKKLMSKLGAMAGAVTALVGADAVMNVAAAQECMIGEIRQFGGNFAPRGWAFANGQLLAVSSNDALFSILGTIYGGDGRTTFALPDLRGRIPIGAGQGPGLTNRPLGSKTGLERNNMSVLTMPAHTHGATTSSTLHASTAAGDANDPTGRLLADDGDDLVYKDAAPDVTMAADAAASTTTLSNAGSSVAFNNIQPTATTNYIVCLQGIYPSRS